MRRQKISYKGRRFAPEIIAHSVWPGTASIAAFENLKRCCWHAGWVLCAKLSADGLGSLALILHVVCANGSLNPAVFGIYGVLVLAKHRGRNFGFSERVIRTAAFWMKSFNAAEIRKQPNVWCTG
ncbi:hypothetical protein [Roseobacter fucihabitans]|uniref:hypothetical protein n=1 Tax=Roseobacter fucihabitans TaxID=1537242 RepID=UPI001653175E|nr:hypothetical protein [Roseobacter litoralis]